jgi:hypothetical protein
MKFGTVDPDFTDVEADNMATVDKGGARNFFCPGLLNKYINIF